MNRAEQINNANPYSGSSDIGFGKMVGFNAGAEWADEHPVSPWISVEDQFPEPHTNVFFIVRYTDHIAYCAGFFHSLAQWESENRIFLSNSTLYHITHWMEIPLINEIIKCDESELKRD